MQTDECIGSTHAVHGNLRRRDELPGEDKASCTSKEQCGRDDIYDKHKNIPGGITCVIEHKATPNMFDPGPP